MNRQKAKSNRIEISVIGSGIAGITTSFYLAKKGYKVNLIDPKVNSEINKIKKDFNDVDASEVMEAVKMDKAFEQIDKVTEFVKESLEDGNEESAIKALEFIEKSLAGTNAIVPQEFSSDMSKADIGSFGDEFAVTPNIDQLSKDATVFLNNQNFSKIYFFFLVRFLYQFYFHI